MYISGINYESVADGPGVRTTIFISGCKHSCHGCQSPLTHNFEYGTKLTDELIDNINNEIIKRPFLSGITLSGGDPMYSYKETCDLLDNLVIPKNNIWMYTGFTLEEIYRADWLDRRTPQGQICRLYPMDLVTRCSVVVDGPYIEEQRDITLPFRGSKNQRLIDVKETLKQNKIITLNL